MLMWRNLGAQRRKKNINEDRLEYILLQVYLNVLIDGVIMIYAIERFNVRRCM